MEEMLTKIDWNVLSTYIDNNLIVANKHPEYDVWILNYSPKVQSKKFWDLYTSSCRGLIVDIDGNILARPFRKFKNYEEYDSSEIDTEQDFEVFDKVDGSLGILFYYQPRMEWILSSRGSFISEQALEGKKMIDLNIYDKLDKNNTYLFEIIYSENRIVVNYGDRRELVLLGCIETKTGVEMFYDELVDYYSNYFTIVKKFEFKNFGELVKYIRTNRENEEGVVVKMWNGFRFKMKFEEYCRLHSILTNVSNVTVWEHLMNNYNFDELLDRVPDEFYGWLKRTTNTLQTSFNEIERQALKEFVRLYHVNEIIDRREFAMEALKSEYRSILFKLFDKKLYDNIIWKSIRPVFSKPFRDGFEYNDIDN